MGGGGEIPAPQELFGVCYNEREYQVNTILAANKAKELTYENVLGKQKEELSEEYYPLLPALASYGICPDPEDTMNIIYEVLAQDRRSQVSKPEVVAHSTVELAGRSTPDKKLKFPEKKPVGFETMTIVYEICSKNGGLNKRTAESVEDVGRPNNKSSNSKRVVNEHGQGLDHVSGTLSMNIQDTATRRARSSTSAHLPAKTPLPSAEVKLTVVAFEYPMIRTKSLKFHFSSAADHKNVGASTSLYSCSRRELPADSTASSSSKTYPAENDKKAATKSTTKKSLGDCLRFSSNEEPSVDKAKLEASLF